MSRDRIRGRFRRRGIQQLFRFESGGVRLSDGRIFQPLKEAARRWHIQSRCAYHVLGFNFAILYELKRCGFVLVRYLHCDSEITVEGEIWFGKVAGEGRILADEDALEFILDCEGEIPASLTRLLQPAGEARKQEPSRVAPPSRSPRPVEHWSSLDVLGIGVRQSTSEFDPLKEAKCACDLAVRLVQDLRGRERGNGPDRDLLAWLEAAFFRYYKVDPERWWGDPKKIPPEHADMLIIPWPTHLEAVRSALAELREVLAVPLSAGMASMKLGLSDANFPSAEEQEAAEEAWTGYLPAIEAATVQLKAAIADCEAATSDESGMHGTEETEQGRTGGPVALRSDDDDGEQAVFRKHGEIWVVRFDGKTIYERDSVGLWYIWWLLSKPHQSIPATELAAAYSGSGVTTTQGSLGEPSDEPALREYRRHAMDLRQELEAARRDNDLARIDRLQSELGQLTERIAADTDHRGEPRKKTGLDRRANSVSQAVRRALRRIKPDHPALWRHLEKSITTGRSLIYAPEQPIGWST